MELAKICFQITPLVYSTFVIEATFQNCHKVSTMEENIFEEIKKWVTVEKRVNWKNLLKVRKYAFLLF